MFNKKTPNCEICEWKRIIFMTIGKVTEYSSDVYFCCAQGFKKAEKVYNNRQCIKLYKEHQRTIIESIKRTESIQEWLERNAKPPEESRIPEKNSRDQ